VFNKNDEYIFFDLDIAISETNDIINSNQELADVMELKKLLIRGQVKL
jgi:hypothetical protein